MSYITPSNGNTHPVVGRGRANLPGGLVPSDPVRLRDGEPITDSLAIAAEFGRRHDNVMRTLRSLIEDGTVGALDFKETSYLDQWNRSQGCIELTELGATIALPFIGGKKARQGQARFARAFFAMRDQLRALQAETSAPTPVTEASPKLHVDLMLFSAFCSAFRPAESAKAMIMRQIGQRYGADTSYIPRLTVDAPFSSSIDSSEPTATVSELLKQRGGKMSARKFNQLLEKAGFLQKNYRTTTSLEKYSDGRKPFWAITAKGLEFGKNLVDPESPRETKPAWFVATFGTLCRQVWAETRGLI
ncbi:Rha family transcriptional regulator [Paraburkholderia sp. DGU8]|uniref:Rha family transcriptional regulator n=1 Tax=Paraburkholderia sp. DGU8 TaxID=3161997 RepID=UPI003465A291